VAEVRETRICPVRHGEQPVGSWAQRRRVVLARPSVRQIAWRGFIVSLACLVGNGASIGYNPELTIPKLTNKLTALFVAAGATRAEAALRQFAQQISSAGASGFEELLGPLEHTARGVLVLPELVPVTKASADSEDVTQAINLVVEFLRELHRHGVGTTLELIATLAHGVAGALEVTYLPLATTLAGMRASHGHLTIATLNYDGLLHGVAIDALPPIADLADGRPDACASFEVVPGHTLVGRPLRLVDDLLDTRTHILQLHGSLGWLRRPSHLDQVWSFRIPELRTAGYWQAWKSGTTDWSPVVVLTDRKSQVVAEWPFELAYSTFYQRLVRAKRWLVVGYGFGDHPVNNVLARAITARQPEEVLVVDHGADEQAVLLRAREGMRAPASLKIRVSMAGVAGCVQAVEWQAWAAQA
jgi:hypothetical protein